jgi:hypothetical protein
MTTAHIPTANRALVFASRLRTQYGIPRQDAIVLAMQIETSAVQIRAAAEMAANDIRSGVSPAAALDAVVATARGPMLQMFIVINGILATYPSLRALVADASLAVPDGDHGEPPAYAADLERCLAAFEAAIDIVDRAPDTQFPEALGERSFLRQTKFAVGIEAIDLLMDEGAPAGRDEASTFAVAAELARVGKEHVDDFLTTLGRKRAPAFVIEAVESSEDIVGNEPRDSDVFRSFLE